MPAKWKIYNACSLYLVLWGIFFFIYGVYSSITESANQRQTALEVLILGLLLLVICKAYLNIRAIRRYKNEALLSKTEKGLFIAGYCLIVLFALGNIFLAAAFIIPEDFVHGNFIDENNRLDYRELLLDAGF